MTAPHQHVPIRALAIHRGGTSRIFIVLVTASSMWRHRAGLYPYRGFSFQCGGISRNFIIFVRASRQLAPVLGSCFPLWWWLSMDHCFRDGVFFMIASRQLHPCRVFVTVAAVPLRASSFLWWHRPCSGLVPACTCLRSLFSIEVIPLWGS